MSSVLQKPVRQEPVRQEPPRNQTPMVRSAVAAVAALLAVLCLLWGLSFPGFPLWAAGWGVIAAATSATLIVASIVGAFLTGRWRVRSTLTAGLVAFIFLAGVLVARQDDGTRLAHRWAASQAAFDREVLTAGPVPVKDPTDPGYFGRYPGTCPAAIGKFRIIDCRTIDGGYLYLQAQAAISDDSGIVYLPASAESEWRTTENMTSLGGPWWAWTCHC